MSSDEDSGRAFSRETVRKKEIPETEIRPIKEKTVEARKPLGIFKSTTSMYNV